MQHSHKHCHSKTIKIPWAKQPWTPETMGPRSLSGRSTHHDRKTAENLPKKRPKADMTKYHKEPLWLHSCGCTFAKERCSPPDHYSFTSDTALG